jgi:hypothetical protein
MYDEETLYVKHGVYVRWQPVPVHCGDCHQAICTPCSRTHAEACPGESEASNDV